MIDVMSGMKEMRSIVLKGNEFHEQSLSSLEPILKRGYGNNLEELKLVSCKINPIITSKLITSLADFNKLKKLSLIECRLQDTDLRNLNSIIELTPSL